MNFLSKISFAYCCFFSLSAMADFTHLDINDFNGSYSDPSGSARAVRWKIKDGNALDNVKFKVVREESQMRITYSDQDLIIDHLSDSILYAKSVDVESINFKTKDSSFLFSMKNFNILNTSQISFITLTCEKKSTMIEEWERYLDACTTNGSLNIGKVEMSSQSSFVEELSYKMSGKFNQLATTLIQNIKVNITDHKINFSLRMNNIGLNGKGRIDFIKASANRQVRIRVDKVKAGFFNVTNTFFNTLERQAPSGMVIRRPYIYYNL